jgi:hypothetical protein
MMHFDDPPSLSVTVVFLILALYLIGDECWQQIQVLVTERLEIDPSVGQATVPISLDIEMWGLHCDGECFFFFFTVWFIR